MHQAKLKLCNKNKNLKAGDIIHKDTYLSTADNINITPVFYKNQWLCI